MKPLKTRHQPQKENPMKKQRTGELFDLRGTERSLHKPASGQDSILLNPDTPQNKREMMSEKKR